MFRTALILLTLFFAACASSRFSQADDVLLPVRRPISVICVLPGKNATPREQVIPIAPAQQRAQIARTRRVRAESDQSGVDAALADVAAAARGSQNLLVPMREALRRMATLGEVSDVLREVFGVYQPS